MPGSRASITCTKLLIGNGFVTEFIPARAGTGETVHSKVQDVKMFAILLTLLLLMPHWGDEKVDSIFFRS